MKLETFFEKFELFADAPDAVAKMRELVLLLALDGRLVGLDSIGWERTTLGTLGEWGSGGTPLRSEPRFYGGTIPWLIIGDLNDGVVTSASTFITEEGLANSSARMLPKDVLLIAMYGSIGKLGITGIACATNQAIAFCKPDAEQVDLRYLFHTIKAIQPALLKRGQGLAQKNISQTILKGWEIRLPPLAEQKQIVAKVDELMALCDRLEAQHQEREARHAALARASLARFAEAPTPANLEFLFHNAYEISPADLRKSILSLAVQGRLGESAFEAPSQYLEPPSGVAARADNCDGSQDGVDANGLPQGWRLEAFGDVAAISGGVTLGRKLGNRETIELPYLRVANVKRGELDLSHVKTISIAADEVERYSLQAGDLLMTEGGDWDKVGRAAIWSGEIDTCLHQNHIFRARLRSADQSPRWFQLYFNSPEGQRYFAAAAKQTTNLASINLRQVRGCPVPVPPPNEQRRVVAKVGELMVLVDKLEAQLATARITATKLLAAAVAELTRGEQHHVAAYSKSAAEELAVA